MKTAKNKNDKRYRKSKAGLEAGYYSEIRSQNGMLGLKVTKICKRAKVHATTFLRHYGNLKNMTRDIQTEIKQDYLKTLRKLDNGGRIKNVPASPTQIPTKDLAILTLVFIHKHQDYFTTAVATDNTTMLDWISHRIWQRIKKTQYHYGMRRIEQEYVYELIGILTFWISREKCSLGKIDQYAKYITRLSQGGVSRLGFLAGEE